MANYIKSFNFRNGMQVDNDNFIVNAVGRVGIGTTVPEKLLDVRGNAKIVGHITATDASVSGIVTVGSITINGSTGTISATSFSGSAGNFGDQVVVAIATDGFIAGATGLTTTSNLGVGTDSTAFELQVGNNPETSTGFGVTSGNVTASGNLKISGISTLGITTVTDFTAQQLNISGVSTITTLKVGTGITAESGIITATTFDGNLTGDVTGNLNSTGISTITTLKVGTGITAEAGVITATTFDGNLTGDVTGNVTGNLNSTGISTITTLKVGTGITAEAGIITATTFDGNAGTATSLSNSRDFSITGDLEASVISFDGTSNVSLASTLSNSLSVNTTGIITAATIVGSAGSFSSIGIQTSAPSADLQIRKASGDATLEVISDTAKASISIGNSVGVGNSSASINYGSTNGFGVFSTSQSLDIINRDAGNVNFSLGNNTTNEKAFHWHRDVGNEQLMSLTKQGYLGIGVTNPTHVLHVAGISTFTGAAHFEDNVTIDGTLSFGGGATLTATFKGDVQDTSSNVILDVSQPLLNANVNTASGISTFNRVSAGSTIKTTNLVVGGGNVTRTDSSHVITANGETSRFFVSESGAIGISTNVDLDNYPTVGVFSPSKIGVFGGVGVGTTAVRCAVDLADAGTVGVGTTQPYFLPPKVSTTTRNGIGATITGATIYNITLNKLQVYTGSAWETVTSS
jgi:hypothetical protein